MKVSSLVGIILGFLAIFGAFLWEGGTINSLFLLPAMLIVFGGTLAAGIAGTSFDTVLKIPQLMKRAFFHQSYDIHSIINQIVELGIIARREGIFAIEPKLKDIKHNFLKKLFVITIDGPDPEMFQNIVNTELNYITERHNKNINLFVKLGGYSPTMGIIGTVMGLISTLAAAGSDPNVLIHHIASAFIATMWGIFMANIVWLPIGDKLKTLHNDEMQMFQVMIDGVYSVLVGDTPSTIRAKLISVFPLKEQEKVLKAAKKTNREPKIAPHKVRIKKEMPFITQPPPRVEIKVPEKAQ